ncbi:hypothetical protein ACFW04_014622 [Cataglyphis niger]
MVVPTFVDLQGFIIGRNFIIKEVAILRNVYILSYYIFASSVPWHVLIKSERFQALWLIGHHHGVQWEDRNVPYSMAKRLIMIAEKREWLADILGDARNDVIIESLDVDYEDIVLLNKLDVTNTIRYEKHLKNCDVWEDENCLHLDLRRLFGLEPYEDTVEESWDEPPSKRSKKLSIFFKFIIN